jgi:hypothetical protein
MANKYKETGYSERITSLLKDSLSIWPIKVTLMMTGN